jgi:adenylate cyclase
VPATLQATIGARIDRLTAAAKRTLSAAAVIGSRFDAVLLADVVETVEVAPLIAAELVDQVKFGRGEEYAFRHPLIRAVAYETQLKSDRAELHRRLAAAIESHDPAAADENAALIAEHFEVAGDRHSAFSWHLRAGTWLANRDFAAARSSWRRAQRIADALPDDDPNRESMRIAPRALLCGTAHRLGRGTETGYQELRELCMASGDLRSLAIGLNGHLTVALFEARRRDASRLADELVTLLESIDDPALTTALSLSASTVKIETREMDEVLRLTERIINLADERSSKNTLFVESPVALAYALRGGARVCHGIDGWRGDFRQAAAIAQNHNPLTRQAVTFYTYVFGLPFGVLLADDTALRETEETVAMAEHAADNATLFLARLARGVALVHHGGPEGAVGLDMIVSTRETERFSGFSALTSPIADVHIAKEKMRVGDCDGAVEAGRTAVEGLHEWGESIWCALATTAFVEALMQRNHDGDLDAAEALIGRLATVPTQPGFVLHDITLLRLRTLMARSRGDEDGYRELRDRYRTQAQSLGFDGHIAWSQAMP